MRVPFSEVVAISLLGDRPIMQQARECQARGVALISEVYPFFSIKRCMNSSDTLLVCQPAYFRENPVDSTALLKFITKVRQVLLRIVSACHAYQAEQTSPKREPRKAVAWENTKLKSSVVLEHKFTPEVSEVRLRNLFSVCVGSSICTSSAEPSLLSSLRLEARLLN